MPIYRLYLLDPHNGHIDGFEDISSADDVGAIGLVNDRALPVPAELWLGSRKVVRFDAPPHMVPRLPIAVGQTMSGATIERAFQLARSGECRTLDDLKRRLRRERCESVDFHLAGKLTRAQLAALMAAAP